MFETFMKWIIGDLDDKRAYRQMMKRVGALPQDYRYAFRKIQQYVYHVGSPDGDTTVWTDLTMFSDLVDLLEISAAEGRPVLDVIGHDVGQFCDDLMRASRANGTTLQDKMNQDIQETLKKGEQ